MAELAHYWHTDDVTKVKLTYGEFDLSDGTASKTLARNAFLSKVEELAPEVWVDLHTTAQQTFEELREEYPEQYFKRDIIDNFGGLPVSLDRHSPVYTRHPSLIRLIDLIDHWARRWNLITSDPDDPWVIRIALAHLDYWERKGRGGEYLALGFDAVGPIPAALTPPDGLPSYNPVLTTRHEYLRTVSADASKRISSDSLLNHIEASQKSASVKSLLVAAESYCARTEASFAACGLFEGIEKRNLAQHVEWTVRFQVMGETQSEVARDTQLAWTTDPAVREVSPQAVTKAVNTTLRDIGLKNRLHPS